MPELGLRDLLETIGLDLSNAQFWYAFTGLLLLVGAWLALNLYDSPSGRALRALHDSEIAARTVGVDVARVQARRPSCCRRSTPRSSGSLLALMNKFVTPDVAGFLHSVELVTMTVLGGVGSVLGAIFGAALLTMLPQVLTVLAGVRAHDVRPHHDAGDDLHARRAGAELSRACAGARR